MKANNSAISDQIKVTPLDELNRLVRVFTSSDDLLRRNEQLGKANILDRAFYKGEISIPSLSIYDWKTSLDFLTSFAENFLPALYVSINVNGEELAMLTILAYFRGLDDIADGKKGNLIEQVDQYYKYIKDFPNTVIPQIYGFIKRFIIHYENRIKEGKLTREEGITMYKTVSNLISKMKVLMDEPLFRELHVEVVFMAMTFSSITDHIQPPEELKPNKPLVIESDRYPHTIKVNNLDIGSQIDEKAMMEVLQTKSKSLARMVGDVLADLVHVRNITEQNAIINTLFSRTTKSWYTKTKYEGYFVMTAKSGEQVKVAVKQDSNGISIEFSDTNKEA